MPMQNVFVGNFPFLIERVQSHEGRWRPQILCQHGFPYLSVCNIDLQVLSIAVNQLQSGVCGFTQLWALIRSNQSIRIHFVHSSSCVLPILWPQVGGRLPGARENFQFTNSNFPLRGTEVPAERSLPSPSLRAPNLIRQQITILWNAEGFKWMEGHSLAWALFMFETASVRVRGCLLVHQCFDVCCVWPNLPRDDLSTVMFRFPHKMKSLPGQDNDVPWWSDTHGCRHSGKYYLT